MREPVRRDVLAAMDAVDVRLGVPETAGPPVQMPAQVGAKVHRARIVATVRILVVVDVAIPVREHVEVLNVWVDAQVDVLVIVMDLANPDAKMVARPDVAMGVPLHVEIIVPDIAVVCVLGAVQKLVHELAEEDVKVGVNHPARMLVDLVVQENVMAAPVPVLELVRDDAAADALVTVMRAVKAVVQQPAQQRVIRLVKINVSERRL